MASALPGIKPFPGETDRHGIGGNKPPLEESVVADFMEGLKADPRLLQRYNELVAKGDEAGPCETEETAGRYGDFVKMARNMKGMIEEERERHNRPLLTAQRMLKGKADTMLGRLAQAVAKVQAHLDAYMDEQRRIADERRRHAEEQARKAREAIEAEARRQAEDAGEDPDFSEIPDVIVETPKIEEPVARGDYGSRVGSKTVWRWKVLGVRKLPDAILNHEKVLAAIDQVVGAQVRGGARSIKGVEIWSEQTTAVR